MKPGDNTPCDTYIVIVVVDAIFNQSYTQTSCSTCEELGVEHVDGLVVPGVLTLKVNGVQDVLDEGRQDHGQQDGVLRRTKKIKWKL